MEKNTTLFDTLLEDFFDMFNEFNEADFKETKQSKDKGIKDSGHCNDEEDATNDEYEPNIEVLSYTDEDFKDREKLEKYVDELENLSSIIKNMSNNEVAILSLLYKNDNIPAYIENLIEHAYYVYKTSIEEKKRKEEENEQYEQRCTTEAKKCEEQNKLNIKKLASRYVDEVFITTLNKGGITLPKSQISVLKTSFANFAEWILKQ